MSVTEDLFVNLSIPELSYTYKFDNLCMVILKAAGDHKKGEAPL